MTRPCLQQLSWANLLLVLQLLLLSTIAGAEDFYGYVRFYDDAKFGGAEYWYYTSDSQYCINLSCFDDKATSVEWAHLPKEGTATRDHKAKIAFFTGQNCTGTQREWSIADNDYPYDFLIDGIDNDVSSCIIYEFDRQSKGNVVPCRWGNVLF